MHCRNKGWTCGGAVLRKEATRSVTDSTCITKGLWSQRPLSPLRSLCYLTVSAFSRHDRWLEIWFLCLFGTREHCQVLFHFLLLPTSILSKIVIWFGFGREDWKDELRLNGWGTSTLASSTLHCKDKFGVDETCWVFCWARAAASKDRDRTGALKWLWIFAFIRVTMEQRASAGGRTSSTRLFFDLWSSVKLQIDLKYN